MRASTSAAGPDDGPLSAAMRAGTAGAPIPKSLLEKNNLNMQALVMARKQAP